MAFSVKAKIPGKLLFLGTQFLVGEFLDGSAVMTDQKSRAAFRVADGALHKPAGG